MSQLIERAHMRCAALAALVAILAYSVPAVGASGFLDIAGSVAADDATPIAGASVTLSRQGRTIVVRSDVRGNFTLHAMPGTYTVSAAAAGYAPFSQTVTFDAANATLGLRLARATTNSLTVIGHVTASSGGSISSRSGPTLSVDAQAAAAAGTTTVSSMLYDELSTTPVIPLGGGSNATVAYALRGPDPTETLVDIDGHQVNNGTNGDFDLSLIDPAALQDVQLIYGISPSSLLGPNTIGGAINVLTLQPSATPHALLRMFGGSYASFGQTVQATGSAGALGYALSLHGATSNGSVNQTIMAPLPSGGAGLFAQPVGSSSSGTSMLAKLRYQLGGPQGFGYVQVSFRNQTVDKDLSALLTTYTPSDSSGSFQSFSGTTLGAHQSNYGFDTQLPLGSERRDGSPTTTLSVSHLTSVNTQSVGGPGAQTQPYLYNQRDALGDDWAEIDHRVRGGLVSFKYDLGSENLTTDYVQGQVTAQLRHRGVAPNDASGGSAAPSVVQLAQTQRSGVLRYDRDATARLHYSIAGYLSNFSTFGSSFDPRAGVVWTPTGKTAVRASVGTTFQTPSLSELLDIPMADRVPIGGVIYTGNPNLRPDRATEYDAGLDQSFGRTTRQLNVSVDVYRSNVRGPSSQLNVTPVPNCQTKSNPAPCPLSYPVNAGAGVYRGIALQASQQLGAGFAIRAGWSVNSSYLTSVPPEIQDGTFVVGQQALGEPLHKAYVGFDRSVARGLLYGAQLNYEGAYNALNRSPYATLDAHIAYRAGGFEFGLYGTNLTNANAGPFTIVGGGVPYGAVSGQPLTQTNAYVLQGSKVVFVLTRSI